MIKYKTFETERLLLKPISIEDTVFYFELWNSPSWIKYIGDRNIKTLEIAKNFIETKVFPQQERLGYSNFTVIRKTDNVKIGSCGLYDREGLNGVDIGFAFLSEFGKKGYAFEAADKLKNVALNEFGIKELKGITTKENMPSQKLLERIGLKFSGTITLPDESEELLLYKNLV